MKIRNILLLVLALSVSAGAFGKPKGRDAKMPEKLRILYWNIQNGMWSDQDNNYDRFVEFVKKYDPDICVWCEAATHYKSHSTEKIKDREDRYLPGNWDLLAARYGHGYTFVGMMRDDFPQAISSRYPIEAIARLGGSRPDSVVVHGAGWAKVHVPGFDLNFITLHPYPQKYARGINRKDKAAVKASSEAFDGEKVRRKEVQFICEHTILTCENPEKELFVMAGDMNAVSRTDNAAYGYADDCPVFMSIDYILNNTPLKDALAEKHPGEFFPTGWSKRRIDFAFMTQPVLDRVESIEVIQGYEERVHTGMSNFIDPSDHLPILIDLKLK